MQKITVVLHNNSFDFWWLLRIGGASELGACDARNEQVPRGLVEVSDGSSETDVEYLALEWERGSFTARRAVLAVYRVQAPSVHPVYETCDETVGQKRTERDCCEWLIPEI